MDNSEFIGDSVTIANSAIALVNNRCNDLGIPPFVAFALLIKLCEKNLDATIEHMPPLLRMMMESQGVDEAQVRREIDELVDHAMKHTTTIQVRSDSV